MLLLMLFIYFKSDNYYYYSCQGSCVFTHAHLLVSWLVVCLIDWLAGGWLAGWLTGLLVACLLAGWLVGGFISRISQKTTELCRETWMEDGYQPRRD